MRGRAASAFVCTVGLVAALVAALAITASAASPLKITNCDRAVSRPATIVLACADANSLLKRLHWTSFGGSTAQGKGTFVINSCEPNCADGKALSFAVSVTATTPRSCKGGVRVYNKLTLRFAGRPPAHAGDFTRWTLGCPS